jgi:uncharacterized protein
MVLSIHDAHVHFFSRRFFELLAAQQPGLTLDGIEAALGWQIPAGPEELAARWVAEMDDHGVERACLVASLPGDEASVAAAVAAFPGRFHGYFFFDPRGEDALVRLEGAFAAGLAVPCLFPAMHHYFVHDPRVVAVFERVAARRGVIFVHGGVLSVGVRRKLGLPSPFDMRYSNPIDLHAMALRFPALRIVVPHFGAGYFREALMLADLCPNVYLDTSSTNSWVRYEGLDLRVVFRRALDVAGARRLLFGTDSSYFPRGWHAAIRDQQVAALDALGVSVPDQRAILGENLAALLG